LQNGEKDQLSMQRFEKALGAFLTYARAPLSVALQGEWGSGKTSLMNRLEASLCAGEGSQFYSVWINTWHYSLISDKNNLLSQIIEGLIEQVVNLSQKQYPEKLKHLAQEVYRVGVSLFWGLSKAAVKSAFAKVSDEAADKADEVLFGQEPEHENLDLLRRKLEALVEELLVRNRQNGIAKRGFIFFVDDLDRIEPSQAVQILEMTKNIFDIENCLFVLAIDYGVVVKGLEAKFGPQNRHNEREFRSFFDKIIQLPFQMPVNTYVIDEYLKQLLTEIGFLTETDQKPDLIEEIVRLTSLSVGTNPRSIKRLANTISFVQLLIGSQPDDQPIKQLTPNEKLLIFGLTCLQISYPEVFNLLSENPFLESWTYDFAKTLRLELSPEALSFSSSNLPAHERWEQIIEAYCKHTPYLTKNAHNILSLLREMKSIAQSDRGSLAMVLPELVELLHVTNVKSDQRAKLEINNIRVLFSLDQRLRPLLEAKLRPPFSQVERKGRMIATLRYQFISKHPNAWAGISASVAHNHLYLKVGNHLHLARIGEQETDAKAWLERNGKLELFQQAIAKIDDLRNHYPNFFYSNIPQMGLRIEKGDLVFEQAFFRVSSSTAQLYSEKYVEELANFLYDYTRLALDVAACNWMPT